MEICKIDHDGYDDEGPKSNLYDLYLFIERNSKIYKECFHREEWYDGNKQEFVPTSYFICPIDKNMENIFTEELTKEEYKNTIESYNKDNKNKYKVIIYQDCI
tara:strand:- start:1889 stop:2197 length:309 start_codon:yes stop_codon:yes gene_type:complete